MTKLTLAELDLIVLHWRSQFYKNSSVASVRRLLAPKLQNEEHEAVVIRRWSQAALLWKKRLPTGEFERQLSELFCEHKA